MDWTELETSTHQDHVIKHVLGATVLGWLIAGEAAHFPFRIAGPENSALQRGESGSDRFHRLDIRRNRHRQGIDRPRHT